MIPNDILNEIIILYKNYNININNIDSIKKILFHKDSIIDKHKSTTKITYTIDSDIEDYSRNFLYWDETINWSKQHTLFNGLVLNKNYIVNSIFQDISTDRIIKSPTNLKLCENFQNHIILPDYIKNYLLLE